MITQQLFQGKVRDLSLMGYGVVDHPEGLIFFVKDSWPGDTAEFEVVATKKRYGFAKINKLIEPSPDRVKSPCPHQGYEEKQCGGCPWMIANYGSQLRFKEKFVKHQLERFKADLTQVKIHPIWASQKQLGYRNRAQLKTDGQAIGFVSRESKNLAPINDCLVLTDKNRETLKKLISKLPNSKWKPSKSYAWNFIDIDENISDEKIILNKRRPFLQGNSEQNEKMREWVKEKLGGVVGCGGGKILELFCGSGNFTEVLAELNDSKIFAIEANTEAIVELKNKKLKNVHAFTLDLTRADFLKKLQLLDSSFIDQIQVLLLDPPREGFGFLSELAKNLPNLHTILYVSCDAATFARDCKSIEKFGWHLTEIQPLDQFPHTPHVEILSILRRRKL